jgi:hypothetical protein
MNGDNMNNVRRETTRNLGTKYEYLKHKDNSHETMINNKNIKDLCKGIN